jgi:hypothetical protein
MLTGTSTLPSDTKVLDGADEEMAHLVIRARRAQKAGNHGQCLAVREDLEVPGL